MCHEFFPLNKTVISFQDYNFGKEPCVVCSSTSFRHHCIANNIEILTCTKCGLFFPNKLKKEYLEGFYEYDYFNNLEDNPIGYRDYTTTFEADRFNHYRIFKLLRNLRIGLKKLLDVGCAHGVLVKFAKDIGLDATGIDPSSYAVEYGKKKYNVDIIQGRIEEFTFNEDRYDAVTLIGAFEHLTRPLEGMRKIHSILKPGGIVLITTINAGRYIHLFNFKPPEHIFYFNYPQLRQLLNKTGFKILKKKMYYRSYRVSIFIHQAMSILFPAMNPHLDMLFKRFPQLDFISRFPTNEILIIAQKA